MKVLLDECVDWRLSRAIVGYDVKTARQLGWSGIKNGDLLTLASQAFEVFVTVDRNLSFQQNPVVSPIAVIVLQARTNRLADLMPLVPDLLGAIATAKPGAVCSSSASRSRGACLRPAECGALPPLHEARPWRNAGTRIIQSNAAQPGRGTYRRRRTHVLSQQEPT